MKSLIVSVLFACSLLKAEEIKLFNYAPKEGNKPFAKEYLLEVVNVKEYPDEYKLICQSVTKPEIKVNIATKNKTLLMDIGQYDVIAAFGDGNDITRIDRYLNAKRSLDYFTEWFKNQAGK